MCFIILDRGLWCIAIHATLIIQEKRKLPCHLQLKTGDDLERGCRSRRLPLERNIEKTVVTVSDLFGISMSSVMDVKEKKEQWKRIDALPKASAKRWQEMTHRSVR